MITKLKKTIVRWSLNKTIKELEKEGAVLNDISINIEEVDGEVYGKLETINILRYYFADIPIPILQVDQHISVEVQTKGWKLYFNEDMDDIPEAI